MQRNTGLPADEPLYDVVWPLGKLDTEPVPASQPVEGLHNKRIGELWDWLFKGNEMFSIIREKLNERYSGLEFVPYTEFGTTMGPNDRENIARLPEVLRERGCDAVISAVGA